MFLPGMKVLCLVTGFVLVQFSPGQEPIPWQVTTQAVGKVKSVGPTKLVVDFSKYIKQHTKMIGNYSEKLVEQSDCGKQ